MSIDDRRRFYLEGDHWVARPTWSPKDVIESLQELKQIASAIVDDFKSQRAIVSTKTPGFVGRWDSKYGRKQTGWEQSLRALEAVPLDDVPKILKPTATDDYTVGDWVLDKMDQIDSAWRLGEQE